MSLRAPGERLLSLRAAWAALAPCTSAQRSAGIAEAERTATRELLSIAKRSGGATAEDLASLASAVDALAAALCAAAFACPVQTLFQKLPLGREDNREGLLALLDLLASEAFEAPDTLASRLGAVDALLTMICTEGDPARRIAPADPVTLSPAVTALCQRAEAECRGDLAGLEAEFFNAAHLAADVADGGALRELGARKAKLGRHYFVPGMLRAIVTYNMALLQSLPREAWGSDWPAAEGAPSVASIEPVFASPVLQELLAAVQGRLEGAAKAPNTFQRIAAVLDTEALGPAEREALRGARLDASHLHGAIVLVGLLCQKLEVVAIELQELGIDPDRASRQWVEALDECVQREVNQSISASSDPDAYQRACRLSDLRNRFLGSAEGRRRRPARAQPAGEGLVERQLRRQARSLASEAIAKHPAPGPRRARPTPRGSMSRQRVALAAAAAVAFGAALFATLAPADLFDPDIDRWSGRELAEVSGHLVAGRRDGAGSGPAFVGSLGESWVALPPAERQREATELMARLQEAGVSRAMLYGPSGRLRVQALGDSILVD